MDEIDSSWIDILKQLRRILKRKCSIAQFDVIENTTQTPYQFFAEEQVKLARREISKKYTDPEEFAIMTRENIENLIALVDLLLAEDQHYAAKILCDQVRDLVTQLAPLIEILEPKFKISSADWISLASVLTLPDVPIPSTDVDLGMLDVTDRELMGYGGMGTVHKVKFYGQIVAMKMNRFYEGIADNIPRAAIAGGLMRHPLVVRQIASFPTSICQLTLFEFIDGINLSSLTRSVFVPEEAIKVIAAQCCLALHYVHRMGIVHLDVKPANILVMKQCRIKLIDFDFAKICIGKFVPRRDFVTFVKRRVAEFQHEDRRGTKKYMAPEILDMSPYGRAADWYGVGRIILESYIKCIYDPYINQRPQQPEGHIKDIIDRLTESDPQKRLADFNEIRSHPFFGDLDWDVCEAGQVCCDLLDHVIDVQPLPLRMYEEKLKLQSLSPDEIVVMELETSVFKVLSNGFLKAVEKYRSDEPIEIDDILEEFNIMKEIEDVPSLLENPDGLKTRLELRMKKEPTAEDWAELRKDVEN